MALSPKQARFVQEYLVDMNATQAALRAGYSKKTADQQGSRLLAYVEIEQAIRDARLKLQIRTEITQDRVLEELALLSFSDIGHYRFDAASGKVKVLKGAPKGARRAISSIEIETFQGENGTTTKAKIRLWPKPGPLELAGKHVGLFTEKRESETAPTEIHIHGDIRPPMQSQATAQDSTLTGAKP